MHQISFMVGLRCPKFSSVTVDSKPTFSLQYSFEIKILSKSSFLLLYPSISSCSPMVLYSHNHHTSFNKGLKKTMEALKLRVKPWSSCFVLGIFALLAFLASFADAETHYHQFVVCLQTHYLLNRQLSAMGWVSKTISFFFVVMNLGSTNAVNEAMQDPEQNHCQWAIPGTSIGSQRW